MIDALPVLHSAPLEYRAALDAAFSILAPKKVITTRCPIPALSSEISQRIPAESDHNLPGAVLWVEPLVQSWESEFAEIKCLLPVGSPLVVIASLPSARLLPERQAWPGDPLCLHPGGLGRLSQGLKGAGFIIQNQYGFHPPLTTGINALSRMSQRWGRLDLGDRLGFAASLRYCTAGLTLALSTVALISSCKVTS